MDDPGGAATDAAPLRGSVPAYRLRRSLDVFSANDGSLYVLHSGLDDFRVRDPSPADHALLKKLSAGFVDAEQLQALMKPFGVGPPALMEKLDALEGAGLVEREQRVSVISGYEQQRYDRQLIYFSDVATPNLTPEEMQRRLSVATVLILGCGGLGSWTASALACAGVGRLALIDDDSVDLSNLNRQILFSEEDVGELKVEAAARALAAHNSVLEVVPVVMRVRGAEGLAEHLDGIDLVVSTADWPAYELPRWVNQACLGAGVPFITAGQYPPLVRVGPLTIPGESACIECWEKRIRADHPHYTELTDHLDRDPAVAATLGPASGLVGSMLAMEALHHLTGSVRPATLGAAHSLDLRTLTFKRDPVARDPQCSACGELSSISVPVKVSAGLLRSDLARA